MMQAEAKSKKLPFDLPDGWSAEPLHTLADVNPESLGGGTPVSFEFRYIDISSVEQGVINWAGVTTQTFAGAPSRARRIVRPNDSLLCTVRPALQAHTFADWQDEDGFICSTGFAVIRAKNQNEPRYLYHQIFSDYVAAQIRRLEIGSNYPAINENDVESLVIATAPPPEQRRIAEALDAVDAAIQRTDTLINKLKWMKAGLMSDLLTRGLDRDGKLRDPVRHPEQFEDEQPFGLIPIDWKVDTVGNLFNMQLGKMLSKAAKNSNNPYSYLANRNVQWDYVNLSDLEAMDFSDSERKKFSLLPEDLLVCEGGEVGRTAMWRGEKEDCFFQKAIHRLRPKTHDIIHGYMLRFMRFAVDRGMLTNLSSQSSIAHLTREKFALLQVPLPKRDEQMEIVKVLDEHDTIIQTEQANRDKLINIKRGLMHDLLTGRVRVPAAKSEVVAV